MLYTYIYIINLEQGRHRPRVPPQSTLLIVSDKLLSVNGNLTFDVIKIRIFWWGGYIPHHLPRSVLEGIHRKAEINVCGGGGDKRLVFTCKTSIKNL